MKEPGRHQRERFFDRRTRRYVGGYFYVGGKLLKRKLARYEDLGIYPDGSRPAGQRAAAKLERTLDRLYQEELGRILAGEKSRAAAPPISKAIDAYLETVRSNRRRGTLEAYTQLRNRYLDKVGDHPLWDYVGAERTYRAHHAEKLLRSLADRSPATAHKHLRSLKALLRQAQQRGLLDRIEKLPEPITHQKIAKGPEPRDVLALFQKLEANRDRFRDGTRQRRAIEMYIRFATVMAANGLRAGEVYSRRWSKFDLEKGRLLIDNEPALDYAVKKHRERWVILDPVLVDVLAQWKEAGPEEVWFLDDGTGRICFAYGTLTVYFNRITRELGWRERGIKGTHGLRAHFITELYKAGADLGTIQRAVGHAHVSQTLAYISEPDAHVKAAVERRGKDLRHLLNRKGFQVVDGGR